MQCSLGVNKTRYKQEPRSTKT